MIKKMEPQINTDKSQLIGVYLCASVVSYLSLGVSDKSGTFSVVALFDLWNKNAPAKPIAGSRRICQARDFSNSLATE